MKINLASQSTMVSDSEATEVMEQPVIIENYSGGEGLSIVGHNGHSVYMSYRMVKEVTKVMLEYSKPKKKK